MGQTLSIKMNSRRLNVTKVYVFKMDKTLRYNCVVPNARKSMETMLECVCVCVTACE